MKIEFEDDLLNFKIPFLKAENFLFSSLGYAMTVDEKKQFLNNICLPLKREMLLLVLALYILLTLESILKRYSGH